MEAAIQKMREAGFTLAAVNGALRVAPADKLTEWQRAYVRRHKAEILEALRQPPAANDCLADAVTAVAGAALEPDPLQGLHPYRVNLNDATQLAWLKPGLQPAQVLHALNGLYPNDQVSVAPPSTGWPRLADIPELLTQPDIAKPSGSAKSTPQSFEVCCGDCQHFEPDRIGDGSGIGRCAVGITPRPQLDPPLYPKALRRCNQSHAKESQP